MILRIVQDSTLVLDNGSYLRTAPSKLFRIVEVVFLAFPFVEKACAKLAQLIRKAEKKDGRYLEKGLRLREVGEHWRGG